ncbi:Uncharacterized protein dnl_33610 [Desulfonema limicola]|uniref:Uncharacterized protein n=1 Tax=Desulfonema limicola TaxID=45656 RepID=A0A975B8Z0_9BACT|nr:Uncharacterized protein dnl_33610 [Desulfonema limicola]
MIIGIIRIFNPFIPENSGSYSFYLNCNSIIIVFTIIPVIMAITELF